MNERNVIYTGDALEVLRTLPDCSVNCVVTSPPYFGLRSYWPDGVRMRSDLTAEEREYVLSELARLDIQPMPDSHERG